MIDYVKISIIDVDIDRLLNLDCLEFVSEVSTKTGVLSNKSVTEYHCCKIVVFDRGVVLFTGSIHKLWNSLNGANSDNLKTGKQIKGFNGNQFTISNIFEIRNHLQGLFKCDAFQMVFQNIEFGVNTTLSFDPQKYLKGLLFHKGKLFEYRYNQHFAQVKHQRYYLKVYNKSSQYEMIDYTLRVELKIVKTEDIRCVGIKTFQDVNNLTLNKAKDLLLKRFNEIVHYDYSINKSDLKSKQRELLRNYANPRYWTIDLKPQHRDRHKKRLLDITHSKSLNFHNEIRLDIIKKCVIINQLKAKVCNR